jgi:hypothetical protein
VAGLSIVAPWAARHIDFGDAISVGLADAIGEHFGLSAGPVDPHLEPRRTGGEIGLAFGVGDDSTAVSVVIPPSSPHIHLRRVPHRRIPNRATIFRPDIFEGLAVGFRERGKHVEIVRADVEYLCSPHPTYPTWPAVGVGAYLLADALDLGAVAFGTVLGSRYLRGGRAFTAPTPASQPWQEVFARAGLPMMMPLAGSTEVTTNLIVRRAGLSDAVRSCFRGDESGRCWSCTKCFRKDLVVAARDGRPLDDRLLRNLNADHPIVAQFERSPPYPVHHMIEYGLARLVGDAPAFLTRAARPFRPVAEETGFVERYYPRSAEYDVGPEWRPMVWPAIAQQVVPMSDTDVANFESWDAAARIERLQS